MRTLFAIAALALACPSLAGPLDPPAGPIAESGRFGPRIEVSGANTPGDADSTFRISQPGSYYLGANIVAESGKHGIEIATNGVTLDLMGFEISGANDTLSGIFAAGFNIAIRNGSIRGMGDHGIEAESSFSGTIQDIFVVFVGGGSGDGSGILTGPTFKISNCAVTGSQGPCFRGGKGCIAESCTASQSFTGNGFSFDDASVITSCFANQCAAHGIEAGAGSSIVGCTTEANGASGVVCAGRSVVLGCASVGNTADGIEIGRHAVVESCSASDNGFGGIVAYAPQATIRGCMAFKNGLNGIQSTAASLVADCSSWNNGLNGVAVSGSSVVRSCAAADNTGSGITIGTGHVVDCAAFSNGEHGISAFSGSTVQRCVARGNGSEIPDGAGIYQSNAGLGLCRLEGNTLVGNDYGIRVAGSRNIVICNAAADNSGGDYSIPAGNTIGTIINAVGAGLSNSNSWANISY